MPGAVNFAEREKWRECLVLSTSSLHPPSFPVSSLALSPSTFIIPLSLLLLFFLFSGALAFAPLSPSRSYTSYGLFHPSCKH